MMLLVIKKFVGLFCSWKIFKLITNRIKKNLKNSRTFSKKSRDKNMRQIPSKIWSSFRNLAGILKFDQNSKIWSKIWNSAKNLKTEIWDLRSDLKLNDNWRQLVCCTTLRVELWVSCFIPHLSGRFSDFWKTFRFLEDFQVFGQS